MIDIHSHIIFGVDDGPKTLEESLALIAESYRQGVRTIIATSHRRKGMFETPEETIHTNFLTVKEAAEPQHEGLTILYGGELYCSIDMPEKLEQKLVPTLNGSRFALIEFSMSTPWRTIQQSLSQILLLGITPVVAHIERYNALENKPERVKELIDMGCLTQVNSNHVLKPRLFGDNEKVFKKRGRFFVKEKLVHFIASDMHNLDKRPPFMAEAYHVIENEYSKNYADLLFSKNQALLLNP